VTALERKRELFEHIVRLRRVSRQLLGDRDIAAVRAALERELGETVSLRLASELLGVSHTALRRWVVSGDVPTAYSRSGRTEVPVSALLDLHEAVESERRAGHRRKHVLEPIFTRNRERARSLRPRELVPEAQAGGHRRAELRALAYHRALGNRLSGAIVDDARYRLWRWRDEGKVDDRYAERWDEVLHLPLADVRRIIGEDSDQGRDLRQNSPFSGMLSEAERRRIIEEVR
jgi:hypothetical protein